jgi:hypothetical protein
VSVRDLFRRLRAPGGCRVPYPAYGTLRLFTVRELRAMVEAAGLRPGRIWGVHGVTNVIPSTLLHRQRLPAILAPLYTGLCALDRRLERTAAGRILANSAVLLARNAP